MKLYFRSHRSVWENMPEKGKPFDRKTYLDAVYKFVLENPKLFRAGDIFIPPLPWWLDLKFWFWEQAERLTHNRFVDMDAGPSPYMFKPSKGFRVISPWKKVTKNKRTIRIGSTYFEIWSYKKVLKKTPPKEYQQFIESVRKGNVKAKHISVAVPYDAEKAYKKDLKAIHKAFPGSKIFTEK